MDFHKGSGETKEWEREAYLRGRDTTVQAPERVRAAMRRGEPIEPQMVQTPVAAMLDTDVRLIEHPLPTRHAWEDRHIHAAAPGLALAARDIMTTELVEVQAEASVLSVAELMRNHEIGIVPVVDERRHVLGVVTDRDVVMRVVARGFEPASLTASAVMTTDVVSVDVDAPVAQIVAVMERHRVRRVPVVDRRGHAVGIVSLDDLVRRADVHADLAELLARTAARRAGSRPEPAFP